MRSTTLAKYADTNDRIKLWSQLSTKESRIRRCKPMSPWTPMLLAGFAVAMYLMLVWAMTP